MNALFRIVCCVCLAASCTRAAAPAAPSPATPTTTVIPDAARATTARASVLEPGAVRAPRQSPTVTAGSPTRTGEPATPAAPIVHSAQQVTVRVTPFAVAEAEDGSGHTVPAAHPVAIELESPTGWPGRALTVTLEVGALRFHDVGYASATTMRFLAADGRALPQGAEVALRYGPDGGPRRVLATSMPVSP